MKKFPFWESVIGLTMISTFAAAAARADDNRKFVLPGGAAAMTGAVILHKNGRDRFEDQLRRAVKNYDRAFLRWTWAEGGDETSRRTLALEVKRHEGIIAKLRQGQIHFNAAFAALEAAILAGTIYQSVIHDEEIQSKLEIREMGGD